jgi:hypothetical protein
MMKSEGSSSLQRMSLKYIFPLRKSSRDKILLSYPRNEHRYPTLTDLDLSFWCGLRLGEAAV